MRQAAQAAGSALAAGALDRGTDDAGRRDRRAWQDACIRRRSGSGRRRAPSPAALLSATFPAR
jgi:hypothetical protein